MTVYVDDYRARARVGNIRGVWSHMFAIPYDDPELHRIAQKIGLKREWFQNNSHYDVVESKRGLAIAKGAVSISAIEGARLRIKDKSAK